MPSEARKIRTSHYIEILRRALWESCDVRDRLLVLVREVHEGKLAPKDIPKALKKTDEDHELARHPIPKEWVKAKVKAAVDPTQADSVSGGHVPAAS